MEASSKRLRLKGWDYAQRASYFVTFCTHERRCILGEIAKRGCEPFERSEAHLKGEVGPLWQRGYHDHIIRCERDRERIFAYIKDNPRKWAEDRFYSEDGCS